MKDSHRYGQYSPPKLPSIVERRRLTQRLESELEKPVVLVVGQAAQGKSTLTASYLQRSDHPVAWIHLDPEHSSCTAFFHLVLQALDHAVSGLDISVYRDNRPLPMGPGDLEDRCRERLVSLMRRIGKPFDLVFDGLEALRPDGTSLGLISSLLEESAAGQRIHVLTRVSPPFSVQRLKIRRKLVLIDNEELAFDAEETHRFFHLTLGLDVGTKELQRIHRITGGWAGGLVLIAEALHRLPAPVRLEYIRRGVPGTLRGEALRYLSEEVFAVQPPALQRFLIRSSLLDTMEPSILRKFFDTADPMDRLQELLRRNLFVQSIPYDDQHFCYRYNRLFRDFLHRRFESEVPKAERRQLIATVAKLYRSAGRIEESIKYSLRAEDYAAAAKSIRAIGIDRVIRGRTDELNHWIEAFPEDFIRKDPWLLFFWTFTRRFRGGVRSVSDFESLIQTFQQSGDARGELLSAAHLIEAMVFTGAGPEALLHRIRQGCALLERLRSRPYFTYAKTLLWLHIGLGSIVYGYNIPKGLSACRNAYLLSRQMNDEGLQVNALVVSVLGRALSGDFIEAERIMETIGNRIDTTVFPEYRALFGLVHIVCSLYQGRLSRARETVNRVREDIETYDLLFLYPAFIDASGLLEVYEGCFEDAEATSRHLSDVAIMADSRFYQGLSKRLAGLAYYQNGRLAQAEAIVGEALQVFGCGGGANLHVAQLQILMGLLRQQKGDLDTARRHLHEAMQTVKAAGSPTFEAEIHMVAALNAHRRGDEQTELHHLKKGLRLTKSGSYRHRIVMGREDFDQVLALAQRNGLDGIEWLIHRPALGGGLEERSEVPSVDVIFSTLTDSSSVRLTVNAFGGLEVLRGDGSPIADHEWAGRRPKTLLMALVAHGAREVPADILIEDLWPESIPQRALQNFKVTLHRLRKVLEPDLAPRQRSAYIHLRDQRVSLDADLCRIDVELFLEKTKEIRRLGDHGLPDTLLQLCTEADMLYRGEFLPEERYSHWAELKRSALKEQYLLVLLRMGGVYSGRGDHQRAAEVYQRAVRVDPFHEGALQQLMRSLAKLGSRSTALRVYRDFSAALAEEIGESPDGITTRLYRKILDGDPSEL